MPHNLRENKKQKEEAQPLFQFDHQERQGDGGLTG